jgi:hypothetical protein
MSRPLEVITGRGVFDQRATYVIASVLDCSEVSQYRGEFIMESPFNSVVGAFLKEGRGCSKKPQRVAQAKSDFLDHRETQEGCGFQVIILVG